MRNNVKPAPWSIPRLAWEPIWDLSAQVKQGFDQSERTVKNYLVYKCQRGSIAATSSAMMKTHHYCHKMSMWPWISASPGWNE